MFHGTKAQLVVGDLPMAGRRSNFGGGRTAGHVYVTGTLDAAAWGAELAVGPGPVASVGLIYTAASLAHAIGADAIGADAIVASVDALPPTTRRESIAAYLVNESRCASTAHVQDTRLDRRPRRADVRRGLARRRHRTAAAGDDVGARPHRTRPQPRRPDEPHRGTVDRLVAHAASQDLHELIPGSTYTLFPGMGHKLPRELWPGLVTQLAENAARAV
ncbi:MAG: NAD(+)--rifampin ADP-ribosyltransferase [Burkholderiaceae bacterium]|nr:NAD(+)--rifampin ADP-ribosyltransferase [Microbacteriaceae bacterium]